GRDPGPRRPDRRGNRRALRRSRAVRGPPPHRRAGPLGGRHPAGGVGADPGPAAEEVAVRALGGRPGRRPSGAAADPQCAGRVLAHVGSGRVAAVRLRPPGPGVGRGRRPEARAVEPARRRWGGAPGADPAGRDLRRPRGMGHRGRRGRRGHAARGLGGGGRRGTPEEPRGGRGVGRPARGLPDPVLGPRPRTRRSAPVLGRSAAGRRARHGARGAARPDPRRRAAARLRRGVQPVPRRPAARPDRGRPRRPGGPPQPHRADQHLRRRHPAPGRRPAGRHLRGALLPRRHGAGVRPRAAVDVRRAPGLHAAAGRRGRGKHPGPHRGLRPVAQRPAVQRGRLGGVLPRRRGRAARRLPRSRRRRDARAAHRRRRLQRPPGRPRRQRPLRPALGLRLPRGPRPPRSAGAAAGPPGAAQPRDAGPPARHADRGAGHRRRWQPRAVLARPPRGRLRAEPGAAGPLDPRRAAHELELLVVALVPLGARCPWLRGAAPQPGPLPGLRPGVRPAGLGRVGRRPVHRPDGRGGRGRTAPGHRRVPHGGDGRVLRRLPGQLDRDADRSVPRDRHPRQPVGPRLVHGDDRCGVLLGEGVGRPAARPRALRAELPAPLRRRHPHAHAGRPRRQGLPRADRRGPAPLVRPAQARRPFEVPVLPGREPLGPHPGEQPGLVLHGAGLPRRARPRRAVAAARAGL
ncbi:MAG: peptidase S9, prolyl oligopeptidase active site domain protein, partial [uncultured Blastococcus sp.]